MAKNRSSRGGRSGGRTGASLRTVSARNSRAFDSGEVPF